MIPQKKQPRHGIGEYKMKKLIDKNILVGKDGLFNKRGCPGNCQRCNLWTEEGCRVILEAPTVDAVEVVHGRWELLQKRL
jgi:hypothetical protein